MGVGSVAEVAHHQSHLNHHSGQNLDWIPVQTTATILSHKGQSKKIGARAS